MRRLLVVRLGSLGDLVHTLPAVSAIRRRHPAVEIDWLVDQVHRPFLELVPVLTTIVALKDRSAGAWLDARQTLRARQYDVAIDFQGLLKSAALARLSGAERVLGFDLAGLREKAAAPFYTERIAVGEGRHVIDKNLQLAAAVGADVGPVTTTLEGESHTDLEFPIRPVRSIALDALRAQGLSSFALVNCGGGWPNKRWPPDRLGDLAAWLFQTHGMSSLVIWGPGELDIATAVAACSHGAASVAPSTTLPDLVAFARAARIMISGDTGPTHIAGAVGTPIVALFGPTDPHRNGPWSHDDVTIGRYESCECHYQRRCRREPSNWCLGTISTDEVRAAVTERLGSSHRRPDHGNAEGVAISRQLDAVPKAARQRDPLW